MKIILKGAFPEHNFGDDIMLVVVHDYLIKNNFSVNIYGNHLEYLNFLTNSNVKMTTDIKNACVVYVGGNHYFTFSIRKSWIFNIQLIKKIFFNIFKEKHILFSLGVGVGPFSSLLDKYFVKKYFKTMKFVSVRDTYSFELLSNKNKQKIFYFSDICYAYKHPKFKINNSKKLKRIALVLRNWDHINDNNYLNKIKNFIDLKTMDGYEFTIVIFNQNDLKKVHKFFHNETKFLVWAPVSETINEFITKISVFDIFVTARFHGAVLSTLLRKPFITIEIDPKLLWIHETYRNSSFNFKIHENIDILCSYFDDMIKNYNEYVKAIDKVTISQINKSNNMLQVFKVHLNSSNVK